MTLHRSDLQKMLIGISAPSLVDLRLGCEVVSVNPNAASVTLQSGEAISADLVIGADGVHSVVGTVLGNRQKLLPTGDCTYRYLIPAEDMLQDADLRPLIETPAIQCWMGPGQHVVGYGIKGRSLYNMVVYVYEPDFQPEFEVSTAKGCTDQMREAYEGKGWDVRVLKLLRLAKGQHVVQHKMFHREPLDRWVHPDGPVALLGDACHLFPPHYGQAASLAIEDAAVLGNLFSRLRHRSQIRPLLGAYESIAKPRAAATWLDSMERQTMLHLPDGPEQQARDAQIPHARGLDHRMAHEATIPMVSPHPFGYDADKAVDLWLMRNGTSLDLLNHLEF
ncbi:hypothetical protein VNI00_002568 [Paramarasmius palmivorus]|uniref:FAD-binding domain-containing protein n=1 Tax=Paramarasmius palmivorus TaxID=297713 RepID=A0AAW0DXQ4_9AGAR